MALSRAGKPFLLLRILSVERRGATLREALDLKQEQTEQGSH